MILLRPRNSFRTQKRKRWPTVKITRAERAANIAAREQLAQAFEPLFVEIMGAYRLDADDIFRRQLTSGGVVGVPTAAGESVAATLGTALSQAMREAIERGVGIGVRFAGVPGLALDTSVITTLADTYIATQGATAIAGINAQTQQAVRRVVQSVLSDALSPEAAAQRIGRSIGLTTRQARSMELLERNLVRQRIPIPSADTQFVREAIANDLERARDRMLRARGRMIAETEMQGAIQNGERMFWDQAIISGDVPEGSLFKRWFTVLDGDVCPICEPLHGVIEPFNSSFSGGGLSPPAHINCRCWLEYGVNKDFSASREGG